MGGISSSVQRLPVHLDNEQNVLHTNDKEETQEALKKARSTKLTAFFQICSWEKTMNNNRDPPLTVAQLYGRTYRGPAARDILYRNVQKWYKWEPGSVKDDVDGCWVRRKKNAPRDVGRVRHVAPTMESKELFHMRLCLNAVRGPTSFEYLRTIEGRVYDTFHEAAFALGLVENDLEWEVAMEEAASVASAAQIRTLFVIILTAGNPMNPRDLWDKYKDAMSEDYKWERVHKDPSPSTADHTVLPVDHNYALLDIESQLQAFRTNNRTTDFNLPAPTAPPPPPDSEQTQAGRCDPSVPSEIRNALNFDKRVEEEKKSKLFGMFNPEQMSAFHRIDEAVTNESGGCFFLDGAGGCGKTTVAKTLIHAARSRGQIVLACASSGIAATLLPKGQTAHSTFGIPIENLTKTSTCSVKGRSGKAKLLQQVVFIVWDEAFMIHRHGFEAVFRTLRHLRKNLTQACGGVVLLILGDLRQTLPVIPRASRVQLIQSCLTKSPLWKSFEQITLKTNMRVMKVTNPEAQQKLKRYCEFLIKLGDGKLQTDETGAIQVPHQFLLPSNDPNAALKWVYGDRPPSLPEEPPKSDKQKTKEYNQILQANTDYYKDKAVLCPKNVDVDKFNEQMLKTLPGEEKIYYSADKVPIGDIDSDEGMYVTTEFLNSINLSGLPPHLLTVKVGAVMMLLRNLSPKKGLCNGTRILITKTSPKVLHGKILTGDFHGEDCSIPRITLYPANSPFPFRFGRRQFPMRHAYVMTINKSQGQTLNRAAMVLPEPCFAHGQLYVAFSRCGFPPDEKNRTGMKVVIYDTTLQGRNKKEGGIRTNFTKGITTLNVVMKEVLLI